MSTSAGRRGDNQDAVWVGSVGSEVLLVLADGAGGRPDGATVANLAVLWAHRLLGRGGDPLSRLLSLQIELSGRLRAASSVHPDAIAALAAAVITDQRVYAVSIGDCRVAVMGADGTIRAATTDRDGLTQWLQTRATAAGPPSARARSELLEYVPSPDPSPIPVVVVEHAPGDRVVVTSDGVHDWLSTRELARLASSRCAQQAAAAITSTAIRAGSTDNATAAIAHLGPGSAR